MKRFVFPTAIALTLFLFGFIFYQLFFDSHDPFPKLAAGKYLGYFPGHVINEKIEKVFFGIEVKENSALLEFTIYNPGWGLKNLDINFDSNDTSSAVAPLIINASEAVLRFGGRVLSKDLIRGKVTNVSSGEEAEWTLYSNPAQQNSTFVSSEQKQLLELITEESNLEIQLKIQNRTLENISAEQVRLTKALSEGGTLEQKAENRYSEKQNEIDVLKQEITKVGSELSEMQASLSVARSITQRGRLTTIARESLQREFRNLEVKFSGESQRNDSALLVELARAKQALALQQELENYEMQYNSDSTKGGE